MSEAAIAAAIVNAEFMWKGWSKHWRSLVQAPPRVLETLPTAAEEADGFISQALFWKGVEMGLRAALSDKPFDLSAVWEDAFAD